MLRVWKRAAWNTRTLLAAIMLLRTSRRRELWRGKKGLSYVSETYQCHNVQNCYKSMVPSDMESRSKLSHAATFALLTIQVCWSKVSINSSAGRYRLDMPAMHK